MSRRLLAPRRSRDSLGGLPTRRVEAWHYTDLRASMADASPILATPKQADIEAARSVLVKRERFATGAQVVLLGGQFIAALSDPLPTGVFIEVGRRVFNAVDDPLAALNEALSPPGCTIHVECRTKARRADCGCPSHPGAIVPLGIFADGHCARLPGARRRSSRYSTALMRVSNGTQRRS